MLWDLLFFAIRIDGATRSSAYLHLGGASGREVVHLLFRLRVFLAGCIPGRAGLSAGCGRLEFGRLLQTERGNHIEI